MRTRRRRIWRAVVSDTAESTQAGIDVLRRGGTAADAAVAVAATLGVTDPYVAGLEGGALRVPDGRHSGLSVGVPGMLATWQRALDKWGRFSLRTT